MSGPIRLGTRGSPLALVQSRWVAARLEEASGRPVELVIIKTTGDRLSQLGGTILGKGIFTKELDEALKERRVDLAVHSLKDVPTDPVPGLAFACVPQREDARDALVWPPHRDEPSRADSLLDSLPKGARIGTSSPRRVAQLLRLRADLVAVDMKGNVDTRLGKLQRGDCEALLLAAAGLTRLGRGDVISERIDPRRLVPAPAQGALGILTRDADADTDTAADAALRATLLTLEDPAGRMEVEAERLVLSILEGGCRAPFGAHARVRDGRAWLIARAVSLDGRTSADEEREGPADRIMALAREVAQSLEQKGAGRLFAEARR